MPTSPRAGPIPEHLVNRGEIPARPWSEAEARALLDRAWKLRDSRPSRNVRPEFLEVISRGASPAAIAEAHDGVCESYIDVGDFASALPHAMARARLAPTSAAANARLAHVAQEAGHREVAGSAAEAAIRLDPSDGLSIRIRDWARGHLAEPGSLASMSETGPDPRSAAPGSGPR